MLCESINYVIESKNIELFAPLILYHVFGFDPFVEVFIRYLSQGHSGLFYGQAFFMGFFGNFGGFVVTDLGI